MADELRKHITTTIVLEDSQLDEFVSLFSESTIEKNDFLITPGHPVIYNYFVLKGCLKAYYVDGKGSPHIVQFAIEDWWITDFEAFFSHDLAKLHIKAIEATQLLCIRKDVLETAFERLPKLERFFRIQMTNAFVSSRKRVLDTLEKSAEDRYISFCSLYPNIWKRVKSYHIANYLGIQPESLSRIRKKLDSIAINTN